jgi:2,5-diamino-6-(ribosylamino)-4(3H)-pyrimidinone 5'-phosphate reductase
VIVVLPKVIVHNSVSLDGSLTNFMPDIGLHYQIAGDYKPDAHLIGSNTVKVGVELYEQGVPLEEKKDFEKPERAANLPLWVVVDTAGALKGLLHTCRRFEYCRDVVVLVSEKTPEDYLAHLRERNYDFHVVGERRVDLRLALELLAEKYGVMTVLTDTGRVLDGLLLEQGLVSEVSLLVHPVIVGKAKAYTMFGNFSRGVALELVRVEALGKGFVWLVYKVSV